jgi:general secretion pathway protein F
MRFRADVVRGRGVPQSIVVEAASLDEGQRVAADQGFTVIGCRPVSFDLAALWARPIRRHLRIDVALFVEQLRDLLVAGLSVIEALDALRRGADSESSRSIEHLVQSLRAGRTLSGALAEQAVYPPLLVALVRSSELTSDLAQALTLFLEHERRVAEVRHRVASASIYPLLLTGIGTLVLLFLFFYVMPRFARVFEGMAGELPWSAQAMLAWSQFLGRHTGALMLMLALVIASIVALVSQPSMRIAAGRALLSLAPVRRRMTTYFLARWYRCTGMLVSGGIPLPQALCLSNSLLPVFLRAPAAQVERNVQSGLSPSAAHTRAGMATPIAEQLLLAGERTGELGTVLTRIADFHDAEVSRALERTMRALEPVVMVLIGLGVGVVVVLMYMPIFELASAIQ